MSSDVPPPSEPTITPLATADVIDPKAKTWATCCHLAALLGVYIPWGSLVGPLIVWLIKKDEHPYIDEQGKESLNFQITMALVSTASACLIPCFLIGLPLLIAALIVDAVFVVIASIAVNRGEHYRYPWTLRLIN